MADKTIDIDLLREDDMNFNRGTYSGGEMIQASFDEFGAGRSILVDKDNNIIAGNKSTRAAKKSGIRNVRVVETDGSKLVVVKRTDISLDSKKGREMALADNTTSLFNLSWDKGMIDRARNEYDDMDFERWGVDLSEEINEVKSKGELNLDLFEERMTLAFKLTESEYNKAVSSLLRIDTDITKALLKLTEYE